MSQGIAGVLGEDGTLEDDPFAASLPMAMANYEAFSFGAQKFVLAGLADRAAAVVPSREFQPVLKNFQVEVRESRLRLVATDLEIAIIASSPLVTASLPDGHTAATVVLPARRFLAILHEAPEGEVTVRVSGDVARITAGTAAWEMKLSSDGSDYPHIPDPGDCEMHDVPREAFLRALKAVRYAVSRAGTRPGLMQVDIRPDTAGTVQVTGSDNNRFAQAALPGFPLPMCIPAAGQLAAADELIRLMAATESADVQVGDGGGPLIFVIGTAALLVNRLMHEFPDIEEQMLRPAMENTEPLTADKAELRTAIRRVRVNADETTSAIGLRVRGARMTVLARDQVGNCAEEIVDISWEGPDRDLVLHHQYLLDLLEAHPSPSCRFLLGKDAGKRKSMLLLADEAAGVRGILKQMSGASLLGYDG